MSKHTVSIISTNTLEDWDWRKPLTGGGLGGSETSACDLTWRLAALGFDVAAYAPLPPDCPSHGPQNVPWLQSRGLKLEEVTESGVVINYRDPSLYDVPKPPGQLRWFVAQDVGYSWSPEALASVDRYITLCDTHSTYTHMVHPTLEGRVYQSSNGVRSDVITGMDASGLLPSRVPYRMLYASSPDRGLKLLLEQWWRIRERFPKATLRVAYGFNNMEEICKRLGGNSWHKDLQQELEALLSQDGITWLGRISQAELYREWFQAQVMPYPSDWKETGCINIMDAMACGCVPVTNNLWAAGEHASAAPLAYVVEGVPQADELSRHNWLDSLYRALEASARGDWDDDWLSSDSQGVSPNIYGSPRQELMSWARERYDWNAIAQQWRRWALEDFLKLNEAPLAP